LQVITRRRHQAPPQPYAWFKNLLEVLGNKAKLHVASKDNNLLAAILTLSFKQSVIYKYGCSDSTYNNLAGTPYLFWKIIQDAKQQGAHVFDLGRSDLDNPGLIKFKSNWGAQDLALSYWRYPPSSEESSAAAAKRQKIGGYILSRLPDKLLILLGRMLYKHIG
jgi:lipid II:glycine glycyltransferase (peptidoglycan interpeptide bridge formation enzyme)